jgi:beta-glucanase (GH16 family)
VRFTPFVRSLAPLAVAGSLLLTVTATPALADVPTSEPAPTDLSGYLFDDEFNDTTVDQAAWGILDRGGDASNAEDQCYKPENVAEKGGFLEITSKVDSSCQGYAYTSGMVQWRKFNFTSGTITIRAKQSGGRGSWPAQWLLGSDCQAANLTTEENSYGCNWPHPGSDEIDIAEFKTSGPTSVWQNVVSGDSGFKTCRPDVSASNDNFHVYSLTWRANSLVWKVDGETTCTQTEVVPTQPMFLIMNNAMGGGGGGQIDGSDFPQTMLIDYVRVTKL